MAQQQKQNETFADADLARELGELTRQANRSNVTMYTIDPRGLVGMGDIDEQVDPQQWNEYVRKSQDSLRVLAEETGGIAVVNQNDFSKALKRIDAETSDYYVLGYYSKNPDATQAPAPGRSEDHAEGRATVVPQGIRAQAAAEARFVVEEVTAASVAFCHPRDCRDRAGSWSPASASPPRVRSPPSGRSRRDPIR